MLKRIIIFAIGYVIGRWSQSWLMQIKSAEQQIEQTEESFTHQVQNKPNRVDGTQKINIEPQQIEEMVQEELVQNSDESLIDTPNLESLPPHNLTKIKGVGKVFQQRLADGGITRFEQLATADSDHVYRLLAVKEWQKVDIAAWQAQARELISE